VVTLLKNPAMDNDKRKLQTDWQL